jgi:hypothetical protein
VRNLPGQREGAQATIGKVEIDLGAIKKVRRELAQMGIRPATVYGDRHMVCVSIAREFGMKQVTAGGRTKLAAAAESCEGCGTRGTSSRVTAAVCRKFRRCLWRPGGCSRSR